MAEMAQKEAKEASKPAPLLNERDLAHEIAEEARNR